MKRTAELVAGLVVLVIMLFVFWQVVTTPPEPLPPQPATPTPSRTIETFTDRVHEQVRIELGKPVEQFSPRTLQEVFPALQEEDFAGVEVRVGEELRLYGVPENPDVSDGETITERGFEALLENIIWRLSLQRSALSPEEVVSLMKTPAEQEVPVVVPVEPAPVPNEPVACTMDAKQCPDGSYVGRIAPDCEFAACPAEGTTETQCDPANRPEVCYDLYAPVCAQVQVECITTPCDPVLQTFSNDCDACANARVLSYTEGSCEGGELFMQ